MIDELLKSDTARRYKINNTPPADVRPRLEKLAELVNEIRLSYSPDLSAPIVITSGYRCPRLNKLVGGVSNSAHVDGWAVDLWAADFERFKEFIIGFMSERDFDQLIIEGKGKSKWIHLSIDPRNRKQTFKLEK